MAAIAATPLADRLAAALGPLQVTPYRPDGTTSWNDAMGAYAFNVALGAAMWPLMHAIEVILRSRLDALITANPVWQGRARGQTNHWFDVQPALFRQLELTRIQRTMDALQTESAAINKVTVLQRLPFGFWVRLLHGDYEQTLSTQHIKLWPGGLATTFPGLTTRQRSTATVHPRFALVRDLRNMLAHHHPLMTRPDLGADYKQCVDALRWLSPDAAHVVQEISPFWTVYGAGPGRYASTLAKLDEDKRGKAAPRGQAEAGPACAAAE